MRAHIMRRLLCFCVKLKNERKVSIISMKYPMEERLIWFKSELVSIRDAKIMVFSPTAQFGLNVFEGIPCYWNEESGRMYAFRLDDHYNRLIRSAGLMQIINQYSKQQMKDALIDVINANEFEENISIRQTLFVDGFGSWGGDGPVDMFVVATPRCFSSPEYNQNGLKVCVSSWNRISDNTISPRIKCGANYINSRMGQREAIRNGYNTCLFMNKEGTISEGPGSCFFMVRNGELITPALTDSVLESITRDTVIRIAKDNGIKVVERHVERTEIYMADEAFMCGSAMEITPVISIDGYTISEEEGKITRVIHDIYMDIVYGKNPIYSDWITEL